MYQYVRSLCTAAHSPQKKSERGVPSPISFEESGRLYTGYMYEQVVICLTLLTKYAKYAREH